MGFNNEGISSHLLILAFYFFVFYFLFWTHSLMFKRICELKYVYFKYAYLAEFYYLHCSLLLVFTKLIE